MGSVMEASSALFHGRFCHRSGYHVGLMAVAVEVAVTSVVAMLGSLHPELKLDLAMAPRQALVGSLAYLQTRVAGAAIGEVPSGLGCLDPLHQHWAAALEMRMGLFGVELQVIAEVGAAAAEKTMLR